MSDNEDVTDPIPCTICGFDLNHSAYEVCEHLRLPVAVCMLCLEKLDELSKEDAEERAESNGESVRCDWCLEEQEELLICEDGSKCPHQFCSSCIEQNLGEQVLCEIRECDSWLCLACNPEPLQQLQLDMKRAWEQSDFRHLCEDSSLPAITQRENAAAAIQHELETLVGLTRVMVKLSDEALRHLEQNELDVKEMEIRKELASDTGWSSHELVQQELDAYRSMWEHHFDLAQHQEAYLVGRLEALKKRIPPSLFPSDSEPEDEPTSSSSPSPRGYLSALDCYFVSSQEGHFEQVARARAEEEIARRERQKAHQLASGGSASKPASTEESNRAVRAGSSDSPFNFEEEEAEEENESSRPLLFNKEVFAEKVEADDIVQEYLSSADPPIGAYPKSFDRQIPRPLLKALFYATESEVQLLADRFHLPRHVALVMQSASSDDPMHGGVLYGGRKVHPAVRKAIANAKFPMDLRILCEEYGLGEDMYQVEDIAETEDLVRQSKGKGKVSLKMYKEALHGEAQYTKTQVAALESRAKHLPSAQLTSYERKLLTSASNDANWFTQLHEGEGVEDSDEEFRVIKQQQRKRRPKRPRSPASREMPEDPMAVAEVCGDQAPLSVSAQANDRTTPSAPTARATVASTTASTVEKLTFSPLVTPPPSQALDVIDLTYLSDDNTLEDAQGNNDAPAAKRARHDNPPSGAKPSGMAASNSAALAASAVNGISQQGWFFTRAPSTLDLERLYNIDEANGIAVNAARSMKDPAIMLLPQLADALKEHQVAAIRFMWKNVVRSPKSARTEVPKAAGCIIAHCMGLGKTFSVIAFLVTLLTHPILRAIPDPMKADSASSSQSTPAKASSAQPSSPPPATPSVEQKKLFHRILIIAPKNTIQNWKDEFRRWTPPDVQPLVPVYAHALSDSNYRMRMLRDWYMTGGVTVMSYDLFRTMCASKNPKLKALMHTYLLKPGPDLVVADEAHFIKTSTSAINQTLVGIRTKRRIALTGSPLQNNLIEYHTMVSWVKKGHLYSLKTFKERFVDPITRGEAKDSSPADVLQMKKRTHVLTNLLKPIVERKDSSTLVNSLPPKREFVLTIKMTDFQRFLYKLFLSLLRGDGDRKVNYLFCAYQALLRVWNHPCCVVMKALATTNGIAAMQKSAASAQNKAARASVATCTEELNDTYLYFLSNSSRALGCAMERAGDEGRSPAELRDGPSEELPQVWVNGLDDSPSSDNESILGDSSEDEDGRTPDLVDADEAMRRANAGDEAVDGRQSAKIDDSDVALSASEDIMANDTEADRSDTPLSDSVVDDRPPLGASAASASSRMSLESANGFQGGEDADKEDADEEQLVGPNWWRKSPPAEEPQQQNLSVENAVCLSNKLVAFLLLLAYSVEEHDKMLLFSQSLYTLDMIESVLQLPNWAGLVGASPGLSAACSRWRRNKQYLRMDGSVSDRQVLIDRFNNPNDESMKLMMISTRAGNMGINLQAANRVVIFDVSWNPVNDLQAIFRAYRFGQAKRVFVYRLVASGTMEQQIYKRQVAKQALAARVVDGQMPSNSFSEQEKSVLLSFREGNDEQAIQAIKDVLQSGTQDHVLTKLVHEHQALLVQIEDQDSFLADQHELHLNDEERQAAEEEFQKESDLLAQRLAPRQPAPLPPANSQAGPPRIAIPSNNLPRRPGVDAGVRPIDGGIAQQSVPVATPIARPAPAFSPVVSVRDALGLPPLPLPAHQEHR